MQWEGWSWSVNTEEDSRINDRYTLDIFIDSLVIVTKDFSECTTLYAETVNELLTLYFDYFENMKPNEKCKYAQKFSMTDREFRNKFIILYERMMDKQPELTI